jgi:DNA-binding CsgD family transcriptional regulator
MGPASATEATPAEAAERALASLRDIVTYDGAALLLMDPVTGLFTTGAVANLPAPSCHPFFSTELLDGPRTFRRTAASRRFGSVISVADLASATEPFVRDVLTAFGFGSELRAVLRDGSITWGGLSLWRRSGSADFGSQDLERMRAVAADLASALRDAVVGSLDARSSGARAPGLAGRLHAVVVVEGTDVVEASEEGMALLREIEDPTTDTYRHLDHLTALAGKDPRFSTLLSTPAGWLTAHGTPLPSGRVALTLSVAGPEALFGARVAGSNLSARETEVVRLICQGLSDIEVARALGISAHTAHDHVRAVRRKLGVRSRSEVAATIFAEHYLDSFLGSAAVTHAAEEGAADHEGTLDR